MGSPPSPEMKEKEPWVWKLKLSILGRPLVCLEITTTGLTLFGVILLGLYLILIGIGKLLIK